MPFTELAVHLGRSFEPVHCVNTLLIYCIALDSLLTTLPQSVLLIVQQSYQVPLWSTFYFNTNCRDLDVLVQCHGGTFHVCSVVQGWIGWPQVAGGRPRPSQSLVFWWFDDPFNFHSSARDSCLLIKRMEVSLALLHAGNDVRLQVRLLGDIHQNLNSQSQSQSIWSLVTSDLVPHPEHLRPSGLPISHSLSRT